MRNTVITIGVVAGLVITIVIIDYVVQQLTPPPTCAVSTAFIVPDVCAGTCPPGATCAVTATRPYGPAWLGLTQAAACACVGTLPPAPPATPANSNTSSSSSEE